MIHVECVRILLWIDGGSARLPAVEAERSRGHLLDVQAGPLRQGALAGRQQFAKAPVIGPAAGSEHRVRPAAPPQVDAARDRLNHQDGRAGRVGRHQLGEQWRARLLREFVHCVRGEDEAASLGGLLTAVLRYQLPVAYLGVGQRVPEDLQPARADKLVAHACELMEQTRQQADEDSLAFSFGGVMNGTV